MTPIVSTIVDTQLPASAPVAEKTVTVTVFTVPHYHNRDGSVCLPRFEGVHFAGRTGGCIYWGCEDKQVVALNERTPEFSNVSLPDHMKMKFHANNFRVIGRDGGAVSIVRVTDAGDLEVFNH